MMSIGTMASTLLTDGPLVGNARQQRILTPQFSTKYLPVHASAGPYPCNSLP
jgi:hypothetical protein